MKDRIQAAIKEARAKNPGRITLAQDIYEFIFKAGMEYGNKEAYESGVHNGHAEGLAEGIKEVVEWIKEHELISPDDSSIARFYPFYYIEERELKEWGI